MDMILTAEDVIVGLLHVMRKEQENFRITADRQKLHMAFGALRLQFPSLMDMFNFRQREIFAESSELDQALSNLDATGLISRYNQTPKYYVLVNSLDVCYENFSKAILTKAGITNDVLIAAAKLLRESIGAPSA
jgi:hypothetical protein